MKSDVVNAFVFAAGQAAQETRRRALSCPNSIGSRRDFCRKNEAKIGAALLKSPSENAGEFETQARIRPPEAAPRRLPHGSRAARDDP